MSKDFAEIIRHMTLEHGKEILVNGKAQVFLSDYCKGQLKKEADIFRQILEAGCGQHINSADNVLERKQKLMERLEDGNGLSVKVTADYLDLLGLILKGDTSNCLETVSLKNISPQKVLKTASTTLSRSIITARTAVTAAIILAALLILTYGILVKARVFPSPFKNRNTRITEEFVLSELERRAPIETGVSYMYILTRDQATDLYDSALSLFTSYRDEGAKIIINRILESNASESLKNKSRLLLSNTEIPNFDNFKQIDNPSFINVWAVPVIYRDVYVIWKGMATNVEITDDFLQFDFLVGYDTRTKLEGIVPVIFKNPVPINPERPLELLGKITLAPSMDISLEGVAIHQ